MNFTEELKRYIEDHSNPQEHILQQLERETFLTTLNPRMLSGNYQGLLLSMLSKMIRPANILEIGTFTGYSAICLAKGLQPGGKLLTIEANDELEPVMSKYFALAGLSEAIEIHFGDALNILPQLEGPFDLVFIDADKKEYPEYYHAAIELLSPGGWIIADNTLWDGKVTRTDVKNDPKLEGIQQFNSLVAADQRVEKIILPIRDGISLIRKK